MDWVPVVTTRRTASRGVTLVELIVVLVIIALLASLALSNLLGPQQQAQVQANIAQANALAQSVSASFAVAGCYPDMPAAGAMPSGLSGYLPGPWPSAYTYETLTSGMAPFTGSGTVYYVDIKYPGAGAVSGGRVYVVNNQAVGTC